MATKQRTTTKSITPTEPAEPCSCGCPSFWRSAYGGPLRCAVCEPWPTMAMVGERWTLYRRSCGTFEWVPGRRDGERPWTRPEPSSLRTEDLPLRWEEVEDEDGSWLVIYATCRSAAK